MATATLNVVVKLTDQLTAPVRQLKSALAGIEQMVSRMAGSNAFSGVTRGAQRAITQIEGIGKAADRASGRVQSLAAQISSLGQQRPATSGVSAFAQSAASDIRRVQAAVSGLSSQYARLRSQMQQPVSVPTPRLPPAPRAPGPGYGPTGALVGTGLTAQGTAQGVGYIGTQGGNLNKSAIKMELAGMGAAEIAKVQQTSWMLTQKYKNFSASLIQDSILEVRSVYGSTEEAIGGIEAALKAATVLKTQLKGKVNTDRLTEEMFSLFKSADLRNVTDSPAETERFIDNMTKVITATGGKIAPRDFLQMLKYGKTGTQFWNDDFITRAAASMMQEGSPSTVGTALTSMYQAVVSGRVGTKEAKLWEQMGIVDPSKIVRNKIGDVKGIMPGGIQGGDIFRTNPYEWAQQVYGPALLKKLGYGPDKTLKNMNEQEFTDFTNKAQPLISGMFGNRNADWITNTLLKYRPIERDRALIDQSMGLSGASVIQNRDLFTAWESFTTQLNNLVGALSGPLVGPATAVLNTLASALGSFAGMLANNPEVAAVGATLLAVGTGLVAVATAVKTAAVAIAAAQALAGAGAVAGGGSGLLAGAGGAAAGGLLGRFWGGAKWLGSKLMKGGGIVGGAIMGKEALDWADPEGNLWGLTRPLDRWTQDRFGFNLAGNTPQQLFPERYPRLDGPGGTIAPPPMQPGTLGMVDNVSRAAKVAAELRGLVSQTQGMVSQPVTADTVGQLTSIKTQVEQAKATLAQVQAGPASPGANVWVGVAQKALSEVEFALGSVKIKLDSMQQMGQPAGQGLMDSAASGMAAGAPGVVAQAQAVMAQIKAVFAAGITVPVTVSPSGGGAPAAGVAPQKSSSVDPGVARSVQTVASSTSSRSTSVAVGGITVNAAPGMDARQVADAVDQRFRSAVQNQLSDGVYA